MTVATANPPARHLTPVPIDGRPIDGLKLDALNVDGLKVDGLKVDGRQVDGRQVDGRPVDGSGPRLTFTMQISVTGTALTSEAAKVLRDIRELAERMSEASVTMTPVVTLPSTVDSGLYIDPASRTVVQDGRSVQLTRREFDLLLFLCEHPRRVFSRDQLLSHVWGYEWAGGSRTVDVHVRRLRIKLGPDNPVVRTVHGVGYRLDDDLDVLIGAAVQ
jgi:DNA-binding winged helix-turn-helix (wHTH) protein